MWYDNLDKGMITRRLFHCQVLAQRDIQCGNRFSH
jgi:hypothetical protein